MRTAWSSHDRASGTGGRGGSLFAAFTAVVWAGLVRVFLLHHATWSVNSICHMYGRRPFATNDQSRDNWMVALVSLGEGWHHSHHAFRTSAQHGLRRTPIAPSYAVIRVFERLGLVWNVKRRRAERIAAKRRPASVASRAA
jgi:stearoyl-CoA desaturase (Delta-9 desaturase)